MIHPSDLAKATLGSPDEHRTSNPLLDRLKRYGESQPRDRGGRVLCRESVAEIERLTAELAEHKEFLRELAKGGRPELLDVVDLQAERDRLEAELAQALARNASYEEERGEENARLRAALERIQTIYQLTHVHECARVALAGAADETPGLNEVFALQRMGAALVSGETNKCQCESPDPFLCRTQEDPCTCVCHGL